MPPQQGQQQFDPPLEQRVVTARRIVPLAQLRQRHRALAQAFEHQVLDAAALREHHRRLEAIAGKSGAGADAECFAHRARFQSPGRFCTSGKNRSFHEAGLVLIEPILNMKSAVLPTFCGTSVYA